MLPCRKERNIVADKVEISIRVFDGKSIFYNLYDHALIIQGAADRSI